MELNKTNIKKVAKEVIKKEMPSEFKSFAKFMQVVVPKQPHAIEIRMELPYYKLDVKANEFQLQHEALVYSVAFAKKSHVPRSSLVKILKKQFSQFVKTIEKATTKHKFVKVGSYLIKYKEDKSEEKLINLLRKMSERGLNIATFKTYILPKEATKCE